MRLKKILIFGFKSFADKTVLEFVPGITAVVGPNGCGKSNISDAFRWVLGEQSAKSMRGTKMPDVIFAGTATRKPLNFAEVTITLTDIQEGELPVHYAEVSVTRRLHRNGESEYFINGQLVRLKDVHSLLLDSGMGKDAYSIFEQGKIDQVINFTPLERRYIFEEAAGILRFLQRKREALRKLEQSDQNISRVKDIHAEVEKQIQVLEQQAEKARVYKENKVQLEVLEKALFVAKWDQMHKKKLDATKREIEQKQRSEEILQSLDTIQKELHNAKVDLFETEKALKVRSEEVYRTKSEKEIKSREKSSYHERMKESSAKEKKWQQELEGMIERRKTRQSERQAILKQQKEVDKELAQLEKSAKAQREKVLRLESEVVSLRDQQNKSQQELLKLLQSESQLESELKQNTIRLETSQERFTHIKQRKTATATSLKELTASQKEKKALVQEASETVDGQKELFANLEAQLQEIADQMQTSQTELETVVQELNEGRARQKALLRLRDDMEGFTSGAKRLLQEAANPKSPLYKKLTALYEHIVPKKGGENALSVILKPYGHTLVVETQENFTEVIEFAKKNKLKDFSLICLTNLKKSTEAPHKDLVPLLEKVVDNTIAKHFLQKIYTSKTAQDAMSLAQKNQGIEFWTDDDAFIDRNQVVFYITQGENNVFMREAEIKNLEQRLAVCEENRAKLDALLKTLQQKRTHIQNERIELDKIIRRGEMKLVEVNFALQRLNTDVEKVKAEDQQLGQEMAGLERMIDQLTKTIADLSKKHESAKKQASQVHNQSTSFSSGVEQQETVFKQEQKDLAEKEAAWQKISEESRKLAHSLNVLEVKDLESEQQEARLREEIEINRELQLQMKEKGTEFEGVLEEVEKTLSQVMSSCSELEKISNQRKKAIDDWDNKLNQMRNRQKETEKELYQLGILLTQLETARENVETEIQDRYNMTIQQARELGIVVDKSVEQMEKSIRTMRQELDAAGDINMTSIEEFDKHQSRYEFLNQQLDDLNGSKQELVEIIAQLDGESRKIFKETFEVIRNNFRKNFKILFNGGEADLEFTETADVLEAGIEIIAKPPGKQMRSINLLSGGEKCLTAMALLFAIFEVKPAPFCILDEIDAPLDDTNVERFVNVVKQFIDKCQFIIITHNKRTMAIADVLFGVSMEERGVSKILSMDFTQEAKEKHLEPIMVAD